MPRYTYYKAPIRLITNQRAKPIQPHVAASFAFFGDSFLHTPQRIQPTMGNKKPTIFAQIGQTSSLLDTNLLPQEAQKAAPSGFSAPHFGQYIMIKNKVNNDLIDSYYSYMIYVNSKFACKITTKFSYMQIKINFFLIFAHIYTYCSTVFAYLSDHSYLHVPQTDKWYLNHRLSLI